MNPRELLERQINAAKDYLRRLHPRFAEERNQREEFVREKESELKELEKENGANSPQLEPCPFCGRQPYTTYYYESGNAIFCHNDNCKERPQVYCRDMKALVSIWNHLGDGLEADYKECQRTSCEGCEILGECENENQMDCDPWKYDCQIPLNPCAQCGTEPESEIEGDLSLGWVECPNCGKRVQTEENVTPEKLVYMWNEENPLKEKIDSYNPFKPCAKCGSPVEWEMSLSGRRGWVKCPRCGNEMTIDDEEHHSMEEWVEMWNQVNTKPERRTEFPSVNWLFNIPDRTAQMLLFKLDVLNSVLGLQRDSEGPVYVVNTIQDDLVEMANHIRDGETWCGLDNVKALELEIDKMKKDHVLQFPKEESIDVHGSFYVTALHIARAICREAELYAWDYEQKKGIKKMSQIPEYLNRLGDWLFVKAEYLRETEECC